MKNFNKISLILLMASFITLAAPVGSGFSYQGQLEDNGTPANGLYDFQVQPHQDETGGTPLDTNTILNVEVDNGLFTLELDFGDMIFAGEARYLRIGVHKVGAPAGYTVLEPRQRVNTVPYSIQSEFIQADSVGSAEILNGAIISEDLADGSVTTSKLVDSAVSLNKIANSGASAGETIKFDGSNWVVGTDDIGSPSPWLDVADGIRTLDNVRIGATSGSGKLIVRADAGQGPLYMTVDGVGATLVAHDNGGTSIGSNTIAPADGLHVTGDTHIISDVKIGNTGTVTSSMLTVDADVQSPVRFKVAGSTKMIIGTNGGTSFGVNSSAPDNGIRVEGVARQALASHGFVKAGTFIQCGQGLSGGSERFFNNHNSSDFSVSNPGGATGNCIINTPFDISNAFYVVSAVNIGGLASGSLIPNCDILSSTQLICHIFNSFGSLQNGELQIIIY